VLAAASASFEQRVMVGVLASTSGALASHRTAAALRRLEGSATTPIELSVIRTGRTRDPEVVLHRVIALERADRTTLRGVRTTGLARTLADLGSVAPVSTVLEALDDALRRGTSRTWLRMTATRLHRPGQRGTGVLLRLLDRVEAEGGVPGSWLERLVETLVRQVGLPPFVRQYEIRDGDGRFVARTDGAYPGIRLGIEAHSRKFHFGLGPEQRDEDRDLRVAAAGWELLYLGHQHTKRPEEVASVVVAAVRERARLFA
jgi:hypothetical protein